MTGQAAAAPTLSVPRPASGQLRVVDKPDQQGLLEGLGDLFGVLADLAGVLALALALYQLYSSRRLQREVQAQAVTVRTEEVVTDVGRSSYRLLGEEIAVRNDGTRPIKLLGVHLVFGPHYIYDRTRPTLLEFVPVDVAHIPAALDPGSTLRLPAPRREDVEKTRGEWPSGDHLGAGVSFEDADGQRWHRGERLGLRRIPTPRYQGLRFRRHVWFERQRWFQPVEQFFYRRASRKATRRPSRMPWELRFAEFMWGWRAGMRDEAALPPGAPRTWLYDELLPPRMWEAR